jgi:hypothetical protein
VSVVIPAFSDSTANTSNIAEFDRRSWSHVVSSSAWGSAYGERTSGLQGFDGATYGLTVTRTRESAEPLAGDRFDAGCGSDRVAAGGIDLVGLVQVLRERGRPDQLL